MIPNFKKFINEELHIQDMDVNSLNTLKRNLLFRLGEYKTYILSNIVYNLETNKIEYTEFDSIDTRIMMRELSNEFTEEVIEELNIEAFLRKLNQLLELKKRNTKRKVREAFDDYYRSIEVRVDQIHQGGKKDDHFDQFEGEGSILPRKQYESEKYQLQVELLKLQEWVKANGKKVAIVFEGRDAAGKGSTIKRFVEYLDPKGFKVVALGVPTEEEKNDWFGRYEKHLPEDGEIVFFDRSWHNRSIVEPAMGYCTEEQYHDFMNKVNKWESDLIRKDKIILIKLWFSITQDKQIKRFELRQSSPLKYWKFSPNDAKVLDKWEVIGNFKRQMFMKNSTNLCPWVIINSNDKKIGRLNAMRYILSVVPYAGKDISKCKYYPEVVNVLI
jgi:polyphosphate kinase 2